MDQTCNSVVLAIWRVTESEVYIEIRRATSAATRKTISTAIWGATRDASDDAIEMMLYE